jgi:hypothetical protein
MKPVAFLLGLAASGSLAVASLPHQESIAMQVHGSFDVKVTPLNVDNPEAQAAGIGRLSISKRFHGPLDATGQGEMLASGDGTQSGAYVALERVSGALQGRVGSFMLMHRATMRGGVPEHWSVTVVPESGTDALTGLSGSLQIRIESGKHYYDFQYALPGA